MARSAEKSQNGGVGGDLGFEAKLWAAADAPRGSMDAAEYKHVVLGLIFLKYISDAFEERHAALEAETGPRRGKSGGGSSGGRENFRGEVQRRYSWMYPSSRSRLLPSPCLTLLPVMNLRADESQYAALKFAIEETLGSSAWYALKETTSLQTWRRYVLQLLKAVHLSIDATVQVRDQQWVDAVVDNLTRGEKYARSSKSIEELLSGFTATLLRQVFLQIGLLPNRRRCKGISFTRENWRFDTYRSVQYVQSQEQIENAYWSEQQSRIGFERLMELREQYRASKSKLPFSKWCALRSA